MARILGLDIRKDVVRGTLANVSSRRTEVLSHFEVPYRQAATADSGPSVTLKIALEALAERIVPPAERVVVALPGAHVSLRMAEIPRAAMKRAAEILPFELEALLPFEAKDAIVDFQPVSEANGVVRVLAAAAPKAYLGEFLDGLAGGGIQPREVAAAAAALDGILPLLPQETKDRCFAILDVGTVQTELCIFEKGNVVFARTLASGIDGVKSGTLEVALKQSFTAHRAAGGSAVEDVLLAGDGAVDSYATEWFAAKLALPVAVLPMPDGGGVPDNERPRYALATALACRTLLRRKRIDLRRGEYTSEAPASELRKHTKLLAICASVVFAAFLFSTFVRWMSLSDERDMLRAKLAVATKEAFDVETDDVAKAQEMIEGKGAAQDPLPKFDAYDVLAAISSSVPADVQHDIRKLTVELDDDGFGGRFELRGSVASIAERDKIATALGNHECFHDVVKGTTSPAPGGTGVSYPIEATIRCPGAPTKDKKRRVQ